MKSLADALRDNVELRTENDLLRARLAEAEQAVAAIAHGEVDAVALETLGTPTLLHAAQQQLQENRTLLRAVFDGALDAIMLADDSGAYVDVNPAACALFGMPYERLVGSNLTDFALPSADSRRGFEEFRRRGRMAGLFPVRMPDGRERILDFSAVANVIPGRHLSVLRDMTDRVASENQLRESRNQLEEAQAIAHVGSWTSDLGLAGVLRWSPECYRIFGIELGTPMTVALLLACIHPADRDRIQLTTRAAIESGTFVDFEHRVQRPDGRTCRVHQRAIVERDAHGAATGMVGTLQDITDRHAAVEALRASEELYRRIVENTTDGIWMYDGSGITRFMNARMAAMLGYRVDELVGQPVTLVIAKARHADVRARVQRRREGQTERSEFPLLHRDGSEMWTVIQANPIVDADGVFEVALAVVSDITAQRRADETRARLAAIVESSGDAITSSSLDGIITSWNLGAEMLYQYRADEVIGQPTSMLLCASEPTTTASQQFEATHMRKDGTRVDVAIRTSPVRGTDGSTIGISTIAQDLTERRHAEATLRRTEDQFRQAQKMEAVGRLAGGIAHDFNNLLSVILSYTEFALEDLKPGDPLLADMTEINQAGRRAADLTKQLLAFSRQQFLQPQVVDLNHILVTMERMLRRLLGEDIELTLMTEPTLGRVYADPGQIEQVVMNLAVNARDAMRNGGTLLLETSEVHLDDHGFGTIPAVTAGDYVLIAVTDTGSGMDAATQARIFEPFFTTKEQGRGTGLGLSTVFGIVEQSGGFVRVHSELDHGTTFKVYLPRTERLAITPESELQPIYRGTETILLVEDEDQVRTVLCTILRRNGYHVLDASNGGEAFLLSKGYEGTVHLLLTDVVMPRMSGRRLAEELCPLRPDMRVLFASGYTDDTIVHLGVLDDGVAFIQKPFTPDALLRKVREVLGAGHRAGSTPSLM